MSAKSKHKQTRLDILCSEDVRWMEIVRRTVDGLAAMAEAKAEGCDTDWIAMQASLETLRDYIVDGIIIDYKERMKEAGDGQE